MVLETQYVPEVDGNEETDTDEEYTQFNEVYVQNVDGQNLETNGETLQADVQEEYSLAQENDQGEYHIVDTLHVTCKFFL